MPKFAKVLNHAVKSKTPYWTLRIDNVFDLTHYIIGVKGKHVAETYMSAKMRTNGHLNMEEKVYELILINSDKKRLTMVDDLNILSDYLYGSMNRCLEQGTSLLVNVAGGFHPYREDDNLFEVVEQIEKDTFDFPLDEETIEDVEKNMDYYKSLIKVTQFPDGKHWYARVGEHEVIFNGNNKWNEYKTAYWFAERYIKNNLLIKEKGC